jgi:hypothetical protein
MDILKDLVPSGGTWLVWLIQAALAVGVVMLVVNFLAGVVATIPGIGPVLAHILRILGGQYEKWLNDRVPKAAEQAVMAVEERYRRADRMPPRERASRKMEDALKIMDRLTPGVSRSLAESSIEAALTKLRPQYEQKAALTPDATSPKGAGNAR